VRRSFMQHHADFFDPALWQRHKDHLLKGELPDVFPYDSSVRFCIRYPERFADTASGPAENQADERTVRVA
jgi:isocitrate dehydrogenase kinase/phosphatase